MLGACDLKTQHQQANMCTQWPNLFLAEPVMTLCGEKSKKKKKAFKLAVICFGCVYYFSAVLREGGACVCVCVMAGAFHAVITGWIGRYEAVDLGLES